MQSHHTWKQWKNFLKMMERRGYDTDEEEEMTFEEWEKRFTVEEGKFIEHFIFCDHYNKGHLTIVFFLPETSVALSHISMITGEMNAQNITHGIIVHVNDWTYYAKAALNMKGSFNFIEKFHSTFFDFDCMDHIWQPQFTLMTKEETTKLCKDLSRPDMVIEPFTFPVLKKENPVCSYWGWQKKRGRLVKITSFDDGEKKITYRVIE